MSALTHSKGISYAEYLWHIQQNSIAAKVKLSDLRSNMDLTRLPHTPTERGLGKNQKIQAGIYATVIERRYKRS